MYRYQKCSILLLLILCVLNYEILAQVGSPLPGKRSISNSDWQIGGIFAGKNPQQEILNARTEFTKKFDRGNGLIDVYFGGPFHYSDIHGSWQDINLNIHTQNDPVFKYINTENRFSSYFAGNAADGVQMQYHNKPFLFGINTNIFSGSWMPVQSASQNTVVKDNVIQYQNIYKDINLEYELSTEAIAHRMLFYNKNVFAGISNQEQYVTIEETLQLPTNAILADKSGVITDNKIIQGNMFVILDKDTLYTIKAASIWDNSFTGNSGDQSQSSEVIDAFKQVPITVNIVSASIIKISALVPLNWLKSSNRIYPITFDPFVYVGNTTSFSPTYRYPFNTCRQQRVSQILFKKSDINAGGINTTGNITAIDFFQNTANPLVNNNVEVKMQEVPWSDMTTAVLTPSSSFTSVFGPSNQNFTSGSNTWRSLTLSSPFVFTNTDNLLIEVSFRNSSNTQGCTCTTTGPGGYWKFFDAPYHGHRWAYSNSSATPPSGTDCNYVNSPEDNPAYGSLIPATRITINTAVGCGAIAITSNPASQTIILPATTAQFAVSVTGTTPTYQWEVSTNGGGTWGNASGAVYSGATSNQLTVNPVTIAMNGYQYRCKISNSCTTPSPATSSVAVLTINVAGCTTILSPTISSNIPATGGGGSFAINVTPNTCAWSISASQTWIHITGALSGTGDVAIKSFTVDPNTSGARNGTITVNGQNYTVNQSGVAAATTYTITGKVIKQSGGGLPNVSITTLPTSTTTTTDAQGFYSLTVPLAYTGTVKPTLPPYTFTPITLTVSSSTHTNIDFKAVGATITIQPSSIIPAWQREGDDYNGTITVKIDNTTTTDWYLVADVYRGSTPVKVDIAFPLATTVNYTFNAFSNSILKPYLKEGNTVKYRAVFDADHSVTASINKSTEIIEKMWDKKNIVFFNKNNTAIRIPLLYYSNIGSLGVEFYRLDNTHNPCGFANFGCNQKYNYIIVGNGQNIIAQYPSSQNENNKYLILERNDNTLNLKTVEPGVFGYKIKYYNNTQNLVNQDVGSFELTKIGEVNDIHNTSKAVVFIGGWNNIIENDITSIAGIANRNNDQSFSLSKYDQWTSNNFKAWYIAMPNLNYTQRNAYDIGIALDSILKIEPLNNNTITEINVVAHSKGGIDTRAFLENLGVSFSDFPSNYQNHSIPSNYVYQSLSKIKHVTFLATPHNGKTDTWANLGANSAQGSPAIKELSKQPGYGIIDYLNTYGKIPYGIKVANVTVYKQKYGSICNSGICVSNAYSFDFTDGVVDGKSSDCISNDPGVSPKISLYYNDPSSTVVPVFQMYEHNDYFPPFTTGHTRVHINKYLDNTTPAIYSTINLTNGLYTNLDKVVLFNNNNYSNIPSCPRPTIDRFLAAISKSQLSGASLSIKIKNDARYFQLGVTDENGFFGGNVIPSLNYWDSIKIESNGADLIKLPVNTEISNSGKLYLSMFKSDIPTTLVQYPSLSLVNQNLITNQPAIQIKVTAKNVISFLINQHNSDINYTPLILNSDIATISLDTGYNRIIVKYCGIDTAIQMKEVYYFPNSLMAEYGMDCSIIVPNAFKDSKMFVNDRFYKDISSSATVKLLNSLNEVRFTKFGYRDVAFVVDSNSTINLSMQPYSYSSITDSGVFVFSDNMNPQYWKTISIKDLSPVKHKQISAMQYDDLFAGKALSPKSRKFVFRNFAKQGTAAKLKIAISLDQIETPLTDSVYLLSIKDDHKYEKYRVNQTAISEYDQEVQKVAFDLINIGPQQKQEIVLMQKLAPLMNNLDTVWHSGQTISFPINVFVTDPDSIRNDITITSSDGKVVSNGNVINVTAPLNFTGITSFTITGIHDFIAVQRTYPMKVIPPEVYMPTAFTPNGDGLNDIIHPTFLGKISSCHLLIFNRLGKKVFDTQDCEIGWDGKIKGTTQDTGGYVFYLKYKFVGEIEKQLKGTFALVK
ncbi:MAG: T9SS type B sorting domain-containing protein [Ferruginibacter sp.]